MHNKDDMKNSFTHGLRLTGVPNGWSDLKDKFPKLKLDYIETQFTKLTAYGYKSPTQKNKILTKKTKIKKNTSKIIQNSHHKIKQLHKTIK